MRLLAGHNLAQWGDLLVGHGLGDTAGVITSRVTGLTNNPTYGLTAQIGTELTGVVNNLVGGEVIVHRWRDGSGLISGANAATYTPVAGDDLETIRYAPTVDGQEVLSAGFVARHAPPVAGSLAPVIETQGTGTPTVNLAAGFTGSNLAYTDDVAWASITGSTLTINDELRSDIITITATNSGGSAEVELNVEIVAAVETRYVFTIETTTPNETFTVPFRNASASFYSGTIEDSVNGVRSFESHNDANLSITYPTPGVHTIYMDGKAFGMNCSANPTDAAMMRTVINHGNMEWQTMLFGYNGCTGLTSFVFGNTDVSAVDSAAYCFAGLPALVTLDLTGTSWDALTSWQAFVADSPNVVLDTLLMVAPNLQRADEAFLRATAMNNQVDLSNWIVTSLVGPDGQGSQRGLFDIVKEITMSQAAYDATLIHFASQSPLPAPIFFGADTGTDYTRGGAAEAARNTLIQAGWFFNDAGISVPGPMGAPGLTADSSTQATATRGAAAPLDGLPVTTHDFRYSTDQTNWTEVLGAGLSIVIPGQAEDTLYVQNRQNNFLGSGAWSTSGQVTLPAVGATSLVLNTASFVPAMGNDQARVDAAYTYTGAATLRMYVAIGKNPATITPAQNVAGAGGTSINQYANFLATDGLAQSDIVIGLEDDDRIFVVLNDGTVTSNQIELTFDISEPPIVSNVTAAANGQNGATGLGFDTDEREGTAYWGLWPAGTAPSDPAVVQAGTGATVVGSQAIINATTQPIADQTGLSQDTGYVLCVVQVDEISLRSVAVATSAIFQTDAPAAWSPPDDPSAVSWYDPSNNAAQTIVNDGGIDYVTDELDLIGPNNLRTGFADPPGSTNHPGLTSFNGRQAHLMDKGLTAGHGLFDITFDAPANGQFMVTMAIEFPTTTVWSGEAVLGLGAVSPTRGVNIRNNQDSPPGGAFFAELQTTGLNSGGDQTIQFTNAGFTGAHVLQLVFDATNDELRAYIDGVLEATAIYDTHYGTSIDVLWGTNRLPNRSTTNPHKLGDRSVTADISDPTRELYRNHAATRWLP